MHSRLLDAFPVPHVRSSAPATGPVPAPGDAPGFLLRMGL
jgi:hypothetical protein